jgi:Leucine-rich repeat (LRR) protein
MRTRSFTVAILAVAIASLAEAAIPSSERAALVAFYQAAGGDGWKDHTNWLGAAGTECTWKGVTCDDAGSTVISLGDGGSLDNNNLSGTITPQLASLTNLSTLGIGSSPLLTGNIPPELGMLSNLTRLAFPGDGLTGSIPPALGNLTKLTSLVLSTNQLTGPIPMELGNLTQLTELVLNYNQLSGPIPPQLGNLINVTYLTLDYNQLTGTIPSELGNAKALQGLFLSHNSLSGAIPSTIGQLADLNSLKVDDNTLTSVPSQIAMLQKLQYLDLEVNQIKGTIPIELMMLAALTRLELGYNLLTGPIPSQIANLTNLQILGLSGNQFTGSIPSSIGSLKKLQWLRLSSNQLTGAIPPELGGAVSLTRLNLDTNMLTGTLPRELSALSQLQDFSTQTNQLTGAIPFEYGQLSQLQHLSLASNQLSGPLPSSFAALTNLQGLYLSSNALSGPIPDWLGGLSKLTEISMSGNQFSGSLPSSIGNLKALDLLQIPGNRLTGAIPAEIGQLTNLQYLALNDNQLTGPIPTGISSLTMLTDVRLSNNSLTGSVPSLGALKGLNVLLLDGNQLEGMLPTDVAQLPSLQNLELEANRFTGGIPPEYGNLTMLTSLKLSSNALRGAVPSTLSRLTSLSPGELELELNALTVSDPSLLAFINTKQNQDITLTQTVAPANVRVGMVTDRDAVVSWDKIPYTDDDGGYQVSAIAPDGTVTTVTATADKGTASVLVRGLSASTTYGFIVKTVTDPHAAQQNVLTSDPSTPVSATTTTAVTAPADVAVTANPSGLVQIGGVPQNQDSFILTNFGDLAASVIVAPGTSFFTLSPVMFGLAGGATQVVTITSIPQPANSYFSGVDVNVNGTHMDLGIAVQLLSVDKPAGTVIAQPLVSRVETSGDPDTNSVVTIGFNNMGTATLSGILVSDVPWITTPQSIITIAPGENGSINCTIARAKRPDANVPGRTLGASLRLVYLNGTGATSSLFRLANDTTPSSGVSVSIVTVVDTTKPPVGNATVPPIASSEIARFLSGIANPAASTQSLTDVSIANAFGTGSINDLRMYFTPTGGTTTSVATLGSIAPSQSVALANVVGLYNTSSQSGTLQIRSAGIDSLLMSATNFNPSIAGFRSAVPIFRSDRGATALQSLALPGVMKGASTVTRLSVQEVSGNVATVQISFLDANGNAVGAPRPTDSIVAFGALDLPDVVPIGAVTATIANNSCSMCRIAASATVSDSAVGDRWTFVDWSRFFAFDPASPVEIPYVVSSVGALPRRRAVHVQSSGSPFDAASVGSRTEVALYNPGSSTAIGTLRFYDASGNASSALITIAPGHTSIVNDAVAFTGRTGTGSMLFIPGKGAVVLAARTVSSLGAATSIPVVAASSGIRLGQSKTFAGLDDASPAAATARVDGTSSSSFGIIESGGGRITVRATLTFIDGRSIVSTIVSHDYNAGPHQSVLIGPIGSAILGTASRASYGDLHGVQLTLQLVSGDGAATLFTITTNNATGNSVIRVE